jgi:NarL family two-component system sensor histidine kinase YdfH
MLYSVESTFEQRKEGTMSSFRNIRPFRWFLFLWIGLIYIWGLPLNTDNRLMTVSTTVIFTVLMALHLGLYGLSFTKNVQRGWLLTYFVVQNILVLLISRLMLDWTVPFCLYIALTGQMVSILQQPRAIALGIIAHLLLFTLSYLLLGTGLHMYGMPEVRHPFIEWARVWRTLLAMPLLLFVAGYILLFVRQSKAHEHAQKLLRDLASAHSELEQTHTQLQDAHTQLVKYAQRVEDLTLLTERQRIARELHDTLAQGLAGLIMQLEAVNLYFAHEQPERARAIVQQATERARTTLSEARYAIDNLRSATASPEDLLQAIQDEVQRFTATTGIACHSDLALLDAVPASSREHVLRAISEGLSNIARHAQAHKAWIRTCRQNDTLAIAISDDGIGFLPTTVEELDGHYGLLGLRERARLAGGQLEILSTPAEGTTLRFCIPAQMEACEDERYHSCADHR